MTVRNRLAWGQAWLTGVLATHASEAVVYCRGTREVPWDATIGQAEFLSDETESPILEWRGVDFLGPAADLVLEGERIEPEEGDIVVRTVRGEEVRHAVRAPAGQKVFRYADEQGETRVRVHTQVLSRGAA